MLLDLQGRCPCLLWFWFWFMGPLSAPFKPLSCCLLMIVTLLLAVKLYIGAVCFCVWAFARVKGSDSVKTINWQCMPKNQTDLSVLFFYDFWRSLSTYKNAQGSGDFCSGLCLFLTQSCIVSSLRSEISSLLPVDPVWTCCDKRNEGHGCVRPCPMNRTGLAQAPGWLGGGGSRRCAPLYSHGRRLPYALLGHTKGVSGQPAFVYSGFARVWVGTGMFWRVA